MTPTTTRRRSLGRRGLLRLGGGLFALAAAFSARSASAASMPPRGPASEASKRSSASALAASPVGRLFADPELAHRDADYAHFAELLGTVMLMREGGVEGAMSAVPVLHDESLAYLTAASLIADSAEATKRASGKESKDFDLKSWQGLSDVAAAKLAKNYTAILENDPLTASGDAVGRQIDATFGPEVPKTDAKTNATVDALTNLGDFLTAGRGNDQAFIDSINQRLSKYNIEFQTNQVSPPARFANGAALITRAITGIGLSATGVNFAPCLISFSVTGVSATSELVNFAPVGIGATGVGVTVATQGVAINPSVILIQPQGANVQPQGVQVAPFLIAVSPVGAGVQPQGVNVAPNGIVVAPTGRAYTPQGAVVAPAHNAYAPVRIDLTPENPGPDTGDASGRNDNQGSRKRRSSSRKMMGSGDDASEKEARAEAESGYQPHVDPFGGHLGGKITISDDPLDLSNEMPSDYRNWASMLSQVLLKKEGSLEGAAKMLQRVMLTTHGHLSKVAEGEEFFPRFHLQDPVLSADAGTQINNIINPGGDGTTPFPNPPTIGGTPFQAGATFFNYAPCVLQENYNGFNAGVTGLNIAPVLLQAGAVGFTADVVPLTITPNLIYIQPIGAQVNPQGVNVQPGLLYVGPIGVNVQPQGVNVQPQLITVAPTGAIAQPVGALVAPVGTAIAPVDTLYGPQGVAYAPVDNDLTEPGPATYTDPGL